MNVVWIGPTLEKHVLSEIKIQLGSSMTNPNSIHSASDTTFQLPRLGRQFPLVIIRESPSGTSTSTYTCYPIS
jgi:hypothetical protein